MTENERTRVGQALDSIRESLVEYVDCGMTQAYGQTWNDRVAEDDARRRKDGRKYSVAKGDLAVLLKSLIHRRLEPWSSRDDYPRIRSYASEILTLRNLYAHHNECIGEHARLIDTGKRLIEALALSVPQQLSGPDQAHLPAPIRIVPKPRLGELSQEGLDRYDGMFGHAGEPFRAIIARATELQAEMNRQASLAIAELLPERPDHDLLQQRLWDAMDSIGSEVIGLLQEVNLLGGSTCMTTDDAAMPLMLHFTRNSVLSSLLEAAAEFHIRRLQIQDEEEFSRLFKALPDANDPKMLEKLNNLETMSRPSEVAIRILSAHQPREERLRQQIQMASQLNDDDPLGNMLHALGSVELARETKSDQGWTDEALPLVRDAVTRFRFESGMAPGLIAETCLVFALRTEGEICNDLSLTDEAIRAFARADEIVDRFPTADPALLH